MDPFPPLLAPPLGTLATPPDEHLRLPLVVLIDGPEVSYTIAVTAPSGSIVAMGSTNAIGIVSLNVPAMPGLELDVIGTSVVGLPVHAGQTVAISIP